MRKAALLTIMSLIALAGWYSGTVVAQTMSPAPTGVDVLDVGDNAEGGVDVGRNAQDADDTPAGAPRTGLGGMAK